MKNDFQSIQWENQEIFVVKQGVTPHIFYQKNETEPGCSGVSTKNNQIQTSEMTHNFIQTDMPDYSWNNVENIQKRTGYLIEQKPLLYLGVSNDTLPILLSMQELSNLSKLEIFIILKKLRLDSNLATLAEDFGIDVTTVKAILIRCIPFMAGVLKSLICWNVFDNAGELIPFTHRTNYSKIQSVIDVLVLETSRRRIYLISCSPQGRINFVSRGYTGPNVIQAILLASNFPNMISADAEVVGDKRFRNMHSLFAPNTLRITPFTFSSFLTEVMGCIKYRLSEFNILNRKCDLEDFLIPLADDIVGIVCGVLNANHIVMTSKLKSLQNANCI